jgi:sigma-B regulation protein RsbU (phosphoserine phosphatase)
MENLLEELQTIGTIQRRLLPHEVPQPAGWQVAVHYQPGEWPGGDYYDFLELPDGRVHFLMADASEQGGAAAALAAMVRVFLHSCPLTSGHQHSPYCPMQGDFVQAPHLVLGNLNELICENSLDDQSMSAFCGILNPLDGSLHFANAGHPSPRWWHARSRSVETLRFAVGLPLGLDRQATYHHWRITVEPGDAMLFFSSGLLDCRCARALRTEDLDSALQQHARHGADAVRDALVDRLHAAQRKRAPGQDITIVAMKMED